MAKKTQTHFLFFPSSLSSSFSFAPTLTEDPLAPLGPGGPYTKIIDKEINIRSIKSLKRMLLHNTHDNWDLTGNPGGPTGPRGPEGPAIP